MHRFVDVRFQATHSCRCSFVLWMFVLDSRSECAYFWCPKLSCDRPDASVLRPGVIILACFSFSCFRIFWSGSGRVKFQNVYFLYRVPWECQ